MEKKDKLEIMKELKKNIVEYLTDELKNANDAIQLHEKNNSAIDKQESDTDIKKMREVEQIKLRQTVYDLNRYISVINRM